MNKNELFNYFATKSSTVHVSIVKILRNLTRIFGLSKDKPGQNISYWKSLLRISRFVQMVNGIDMATHSDVT